MITKQSALKTATFGLSGAIALGVLGVSIVYVSGLSSRKQASLATQVQPAPIRTVTALGRVEPTGEVIKLSVANATDSRVDRLLVKEGEQVTAGQIIATLQGLDKQEAAVAEAELNVRVKQAELAQAEAGEKLEDIVAQEAVVARIEAQLRTQVLQNEAELTRTQAELTNAQAEYRRYQELYTAGAVSTSELEAKQTTFETAQAVVEATQNQLDNTILTLQRQIQEERAKLASLRQIRPVDVQSFQAEVDYAIAQVERAKASLNDYYVRVPVDGRILKINTQVGEQVDPNEGIVDLGQTDQMYVIAEVYETDITKVKLGQRATIRSENGGFEEILNGTVDFISLQIKKQDILDSDPAADVDARVVEVKIRLDPNDSPVVAALTNLKVRVTIDLD